MEPTPSNRPKPNLSCILSESEQILRSDYTRSIALSLLFLPLSFYLISGHLFTTHHFHKLPTLCHCFCFVIVYLLSLCAISTITYATHHSFSGKPISLITTINSLTSSFFPILTTATVAHTLLVLISVTSLLFVKTNLILLNNLGFVTVTYLNHNLIYFMCFCSITFSVFLIVIVTYIHVNWFLAFVVVVAESKSGFAALTRSWYLMKGVRSVSLLLCLYFGFFVGITVWVTSDCIRALSDRGYVLFAMIVGSSMLISYLRQATVAVTVLYNYCKVLHCEVDVNEFVEKVAEHVVEA
ncbi:hypothetical protein QVD17_31745 [Tagetes erecta]|uniref:Uncharacterized protein n=1 Tax=Tagetes erecta TaxID=13708 RepID=A0AAD8K4D5_TARER|nr:hypothetical protein QVD17_31745 [Tagetes erecta]